MRGFIQIPILIAVVISAAIFGGGGYLIAQNVSRAPAGQETSQSTVIATAPTVATTTPDTATSSIKSRTTVETPSNTEQKKTTSTKIQSSATIVADPIAVPQSVSIADVCLNIEGIQSTVPVGLTSSSNICTATITVLETQANDLCPNILGLQSSIPEGKTFYRNTQTCLTNSEIEEIENEIAAASATKESCQKAKDDMHAIQIQIQDVEDKYDALIAAARLNPDGKSGGAVEADVADLQRKESAELSPLESQRYRINNDYIYYCN
ncbi:hypothetical protein C4568_04885 [Candidatus Parcubacteria bacterium]|nr:MAG: hypothetical protein C4568_04885 [Candidatus Parcubacteria bacterium]